MCLLALAEMPDPPSRRVALLRRSSWCRYVQGQVARFVHPSSGRMGASFDKNRFRRKSCAAMQLKAFASTLIACHFFGMFAGRALLVLVPTLPSAVTRLTLEPIGIA